MRYEELLQLVNYRPAASGKGIVKGYRFEEYRQLARATEQVDYDCDYHNGICTGRMYGAPNCCWQCASSFGYWGKEPGALDDATLSTFAGYFDARTGFLEEGYGCRLPRELRSPTCLYIYCSAERMSEADLELLGKIKNGRACPETD